MIVAVTEQWPDRPACGTFVEITAPNGKSIIVRTVDLCGGCVASMSSSLYLSFSGILTDPHLIFCLCLDVPHADLSKAAFQKLYPLDIGLVHGLSMKKVDPPKKDWSTKLYGPRYL
jgi:hypothetical protein